MNRRLQLWLGVSTGALLGTATLSIPSWAGDFQDRDLDPGGFQHECGEPGGCAEAGERIESRSADEFGEDGTRPLVTPARPLSGNGGLSTGDSVRGGMNDGGLGGNRGGSSLGGGLSR